MLHRLHPPLPPSRTLGRMIRATFGENIYRADRIPVLNSVRSWQGTVDSLVHCCSLSTIHCPQCVSCPSPGRRCYRQGSCSRSVVAGLGPGSVCSRRGRAARSVAMLIMRRCGANLSGPEPAGMLPDVSFPDTLVAGAYRCTVLMRQFRTGRQECVFLRRSVLSADGWNGKRPASLVTNALQLIDASPSTPAQ